jgi:hypothetical protein
MAAYLHLSSRFFDPKPAATFGKTCLGIDPNGGFSWSLEKLMQNKS